MKGKADNVINYLVVTEGVVAALVCDNPHAGECAALEDPIERPGDVGEEGEREEVEVRGGDVVEEEG